MTNDKIVHAQYFTFLNCIFVSEAYETAICHANELVQHHSCHVVLWQIGETSALAKWDLEEPEIL